MVPVPEPSPSSLGAVKVRFQPPDASSIRRGARRATGCSIFEDAVAATVASPRHTSVRLVPGIHRGNQVSVASAAVRSERGTAVVALSVASP